MNRSLPLAVALSLTACGPPVVVDDFPAIPPPSLPGPEAPERCDWATEPRLAVTSTGQPSTLVRTGEALFSSWFLIDPQRAAVHVLRTDLPALTSTTIWEGDATHTLIGATPEAVYLLRSDDTPSWLEVVVLDHSGAPVRSASLTGLGVNGFTGLRVGQSLYAISHGALLRDTPSGWVPLGDALVSRFISSPGATELLVLDDRHQVCVVDEVAKALSPCVAMPTDVGPGTQVYDVAQAHRRGSAWAMSAYFDPGGIGVLTNQGSGWQLVEATQNRWTLNDLIDVEGGWLWLRQESVTMNDFRTLAIVNWTSHAEPTELWRVDGQATSLTPTRCGLAFAVNLDGIHTVRLPEAP